MLAKLIPTSRTVASHPEVLIFFHSDSSFKVSYFSFWNFWPNFVQEIRRHTTRDLFDQASRRRVDRSFTFVCSEFWTSMARVHVSFFFHHFLLGTSKNELDRYMKWPSIIRNLWKKAFPIRRLSRMAARVEKFYASKNLVHLLHEVIEQQ